MVFAHGPGSFIAAHTTKKWWAKDISEAFQKKLLILSAILGAAVDLDMLFVWFFDGRNSHREFLTHTPILYVFITVIILGFGAVLKNKKVFAIGKVFFVATITHIILDSLFGGIMWLFPFSDEFYGLMLFDSLANSLYGVYSLFINYSLEALFFALAGVIVLRHFTKRKTKKVTFAQIGLIAGWSIFTITFFVFSFNTYRIGGNLHLTDIDGDGILNTKDFDMDGDGIDNVNDRDASGDGIENRQKFAESLERMKNVSFTPGDGIIYEFAGRLGFFDEKDVIRQAFAHTGISMKQELIRDYENNPDMYDGVPTDNDFDTKIQNYYAFFESKEYIQGALQIDTESQVGDVVFIIDITDQGERVINSGVFSSQDKVLFVPENKWEYHNSNQLAAKEFFDTIKYNHDFEGEVEIRFARLTYKN